MSASDVVDLAKAPERPVDIGERARLAARRRDRILSIASPLGLLLAWELAAQTGLIDVRFFPAPSAIIAQADRDGAVRRAHRERADQPAADRARLPARRRAGDRDRDRHGDFGGRSARIVDPLIVATYPIPKSSLLPLILLIFGLGEMSKVVMVAIGVFYPMAINATAGVLQINQIYLDVGKSFKASPLGYVPHHRAAGRAAVHHDRGQARRRARARS